LPKTLTLIEVYFLEDVLIFYVSLFAFDKEVFSDYELKDVL
jgi:hypothetical protein